jgi:hypothetical protein
MLGVMRAMVGLLPFTGNKIRAQPPPMTSERRIAHLVLLEPADFRSSGRTSPVRDPFRWDPKAPHTGAGGARSRAMSIRRFRAKPDKSFVDVQAAMPSSWKTRRMASFRAS